jgi:hypothetical protein
MITIPDVIRPPVEFKGRSATQVRERVSKYEPRVGQIGLRVFIALNKNTVTVQRASEDTQWIKVVDEMDEVIRFDKRHPMFITWHVVRFGSVYHWRP